MSFEEIVQVATQNSLSVVIILYFLYRDWKYNEQLLLLMSELKQILSHINEREVKDNGST